MVRILTCHTSHTLSCSCQNYCSPANFDTVWRKTREGRPKMSVRWLQQLHVHYPELARRAEESNTKDCFTMYCNQKSK